MCAHTRVFNINVFLSLIRDLFCIYSFQRNIFWSINYLSIAEGVCPFHQFLPLSLWFPCFLNAKDICHVPQSPTPGLVNSLHNELPPKVEARSSPSQPPCSQASHLWLRLSQLDPSMWEFCLRESNMRNQVPCMTQRNSFLVRVTSGVLMSQRDPDVQW